MNLRIGFVYSFAGAAAKLMYYLPLESETVMDVIKWTTRLRQDYFLMCQKITAVMKN